MKAILAMDAYNRGYNPGISFGSNSKQSPDTPGIKIGNAEIYRANGDAAAQAVGFYAIAYEYNGQKVISYRGTDDGQDIIHGWPAGGGAVTVDQAEMAFEFYKSVANGSDPRVANISLTGHSLGGGLVH